MDFSSIILILFSLVVYGWAIHFCGEVLEEVPIVTEVPLLPPPVVEELPAIVEEVAEEEPIIEEPVIEEEIPAVEDPIVEEPPPVEEIIPTVVEELFEEEVKTSEGVSVHIRGNLANNHVTAIYEKDGIKKKCQIFIPGHLNGSNLADIPTHVTVSDLPPEWLSYLLRRPEAKF